MTKKRSPNILIIDDVPASQQVMLDGLPDDLAKCFKIRDPNKALSSDLKQAHLVLVDYKLDKWEQNANSDNLCQHIPNGLALAAILQQHATANAHAVAFAIHSAHLPELTHPFKLDPRIHLLAKSCNVDWAFEKDTTAKSRESYLLVKDLAEAVQSLPPSWPPDNPTKVRQEARRLLGITRALSWADQAWVEVERAGPPLDELVHRIHGLLFLRWLLQRVLPYPSFLLDTFWLSARLGATPSSVTTALDGRLDKILSPAAYVGLLHNFRGPRWWRTGIEVVFWDLGGKQPIGRDELHRVLSSKGVELEMTPSPHPIVCLNEDLQTLPDLADSSIAVRIQPDDWPSYADFAWTPIDLAKTSRRLRALVIEADHRRVDIVSGSE